MHEGCAYPSPWRGNFMAQFEAAEVDTAFLPYPCLDFPCCLANPDQQIQISILLLLLSSCKRRDTSLCGKDKKEHSLPLVVVTRSFSPLSTALTANKEILPIWQNISRVTFDEAGFMCCEKQGAEGLGRQGWSCLILCTHTGWKGGSRAWGRLLSTCWIPQVRDEVVLPSCRGWGRMWLNPSQPRQLLQLPVALWVCSKLHQNQLELLNWGVFSAAPTAALVVYLDCLEQEEAHVDISAHVDIAWGFFTPGTAVLNLWGQRPLWAALLSPSNTNFFKATSPSYPCSVLGISSVFLPLLAGKTDFTSMQRHYQKISLPSQWKHLKSITDVERENVLPSWKTEFGSKLLADIIITSLS